MLETSASQSLYGGQFTLSTQLIKPNYLVKFSPGVMLYMFSPLSFGQKFSCDNDQHETIVLYCRRDQYCIILPSRNKLFPQNPFEFLHIRESLVSRSSRLDTRDSILERFKHRG